jgi:hypothetical protein
VVERIAHHQGVPVDDGQDGEEVIRAAVLLAAHDEHAELPAPAMVSADWPDDPAYQAASAAWPSGRSATASP